MPITPEDRARENIDRLLTDAGWIVQDKRSANLSAGRGIAVREFPLKPGHGEADYLLFIDGAPVGVVEAKKEGDTLTGLRECAKSFGNSSGPGHLRFPEFAVLNSVRKLPNEVTLGEISWLTELRGHCGTFIISR